MAPFSVHNVLTGLKDRIESLLLQGDTLYLGTSTGSLITYTLERDGEDYSAVSPETKTNFTRRSIEQLGYIRDVNSLVTLSDGVVTLFPLPNFSPQTSLTQARNALSFAIHASVQMITPDGQQPTSPGGRQQGVPTVVTQLAIGCRKKVVIYTWKDGEAQEVKELNLPHSPRGLAFANAQMLVFAYTVSEHAIAYLNTMSVAELILPSSNTGSATSTAAGLVGIGKLNALGGYMLGAKTQKPSVIQLSDDEVLVTKEMTSFFIGPDGKPSRALGMTWTGAPDDTTFVKPYILTIIPAISGSVIGSNSSSITPSHIQIRSSLSLSSVQSLSYPFLEDGSISTVAPPPSTTRLLTCSPGAKSPAFVLTTPTEKAAAARVGTTLWVIIMRPWATQLDENVAEGKYEEALKLLEIIDQTVLEDKPRRIAQIRALHAVSLFARGSYDPAINAFIELDTNPAKVVAMHSPQVSGRLTKEREEWIALFGGTRLLPDDNSVTSNRREKTVANMDDPSGATATVVATDELNASDVAISEVEAGSMGVTNGSGIGTEASKPPHSSIGPSSSGENLVEDDKLRSMVSVNKGIEKQSVETLLRYLSDRRPKISGALASHGITPSHSSQHPSLSSFSPEELFSLPDGVPLASCIPSELLRFAQIVDTALFKSYLVVRPSLVGSLCRVDNWCEVEEVEGELRDRKKFSELIDLYRGKKMHQKALALIRELSINEPDMEDKLEPAVRYLQKLGPEYLDLIFTSARWVLDVDHTYGLQIFTTEEAQFPRDKVSAYLMEISPALCAGYMEYLIDEAGEANPTFHDHLAELYLKAAIDTRRSNDSRDASLSKLLNFIRTSEFYSPDRLFGRLPQNSLLEVRAILLGRLGEDEAALEIYVHRLQDYDEAEEYCKRAYQANPGHSSAFLTLLKIYLRSSPPPSPPEKDQPDSLLVPALELISRHSSKLDSAAVLALLPPLVPASSVRTFLLDALDPSLPMFFGNGTSRAMAHVMREVCKARKTEVDAQVVGLRARKVRVEESRICPHCHKRLGSSVIAVHQPRGEVTHFHCREPFATQKKAMNTGRRY